MAGTEELELKMEPIRNFCERIDGQFLKQMNFLKYFKNMGMINSVSRVRDLADKQLEKYNKLVEEYKHDRY